MRLFKNFIWILLVVITIQSCNSYQLASYYDDYDGIYGSNLNSSKYEKIFDDIAYDISEEDLVSSSSGLPWGDNPESTEVVFNFFPNYSFNPYYYGSYNSFRLNPYYNNYYMYSYYSPYYSPYGYYFRPYNSFENPYWYHYRFSGYYPYYNYRAYEKYSKDYLYGANGNVSYVKVNSRRGEKQSSRSRSNRSELSNVSSVYSRGSNIINSPSNFDGIENDRIIKNARTDEVRLYQSDRIYTRNRDGSRAESRGVSNYVPNLNSIKREQIKNTYREARSFRNPINPIDYNNSSYNYNSRNNNRSNYTPSNNRSYNSSSRASSGSSFSRSSSSGTSRSSSSSRGTSSRGSGKIN